MADLTAEEIAELRRLRQAAEGHWGGQGISDAPLHDFRRTAQEKLPRLLDEIEERRARYGDHLDVVEIAHKDGTAAREWIGRAKELLKQIEWASTDNTGDTLCPSCSGSKPYARLHGDKPAAGDTSVLFGHEPDCELAALIGGISSEPPAPYTDALGARIRFGRTNFASGKAWKPGDRISLNGRQLILDTDSVTFRPLRPEEE